MTRWTLKRFLAVGMTASAVWLSACASMPIGAGVEFVSIAPPPPQYEVVVASPGPDYFWIRGHWRWDGAAYDWVPGHYERVPPGRHRWEEGRWRHHGRGWYWSEGRWR